MVLKIFFKKKGRLILNKSYFYRQYQLPSHSLSS